MRRDAKGVTGVSPFWERLSKGDGAAIARDFDGAIASYRDAVAQEPQNALGHYRIGEVHILRGDLKEADVAFAAALRFAASDPAVKAKVLFRLADLRERHKATDEAIQRWSDYEAQASVDAKAKTFPASAAERRKRNEDWKKLSADAAGVRTRIEKRLKEAEESVKKSSK